MKLFVPLVAGMRGTTDGTSVFTSRDLAEEYASRHFEGASIESYEVPGYDPAQPIFHASAYDEQIDLYDFVGLFATFDEAKRKAGNRSLVLSLKVDPK